MSGTPPDASNKTINWANMKVGSLGTAVGSLTTVGTLQDLEITFPKENHDILENISARPTGRIEFLGPATITATLQDIHENNFESILGLTAAASKISLTKDKIDTECKVLVRHTYPSDDQMDVVLYKANFTGDLSLPFSSDSLAGMSIEITGAICVSGDTDYSDGEEYGYIEWS